MKTTNEEKERLKAIQDQCQQALEPFKEEFNKVKLAYHEKKKEIFRPLEDALHLYYNEHLLDKNGKTIEVGREFMIGKKLKFRIVDRSMQFILGNMMFNPMIYCQRVNDDGSLDVKTPIRSFSEEDCKHLNFI